jgi:hypothetical protein
VPYTPVTEDQFEVTDQGMKHVPTACEFTCHTGSPHSGSRREGAPYSSFNPNANALPVAP